MRVLRGSPPLFAFGEAAVRALATDAQRQTIVADRLRWAPEAKVPSPPNAAADSPLVATSKRPTLRQMFLSPASKLAGLFSRPLPYLRPAVLKRPNVSSHRSQARDRLSASRGRCGRSGSAGSNRHCRTAGQGSNRAGGRSRGRTYAQSRGRGRLACLRSILPGRLQCRRLARQLEFRSGREILDVVGVPPGARQRLTTDVELAARAAGNESACNPPRHPVPTRSLVHRVVLPAGLAAFSTLAVPAARFRRFVNHVIGTSPPESLDYLE